MEATPQVLRILKAFQAAWKSGARPNIAELLDNLAEPARSSVLRELVTLDVEYRSRAGESPRASDYGDQFPDSRDIIESVFSDTQSLVGQSPPETLMRPAGNPVRPVSSIDATRTSIGAKEDRKQRTPTPSPSPTEDRSKAIVPLNEFTRALTDSGLMDAEELNAFIASLPADHRPENGKQLAQDLHRCKKLTRFQVQAVYQGKTRGLVVGNYVVLDKLGEGGMGQVYKARHKRMDRVVALKVLPAGATKSPESVKRFQREVKAAAKLTHPNIVTAYDADEHRGVHFLVMEYVEGKDLAGFVREKGPLPVKQAVDCIMQAAKGLDYAHRQGIIHRDIKPHNLLLDKSGTVKILDMGLARLDEQMHKQADDDGLTRSGAVMGTLDYMSPEQALDTKTADARADMYSLGCTLHYLLTGKAPYRGDSLAAKIFAHRMETIPSLRAERMDVPDSLDQIFRKMLGKSPSDRQQAMTEVISELEALIARGDLNGAQTGRDDKPAYELPDVPRDFEEQVDFLGPDGATIEKPVELTSRLLAPSLLRWRQAWSVKWPPSRTGGYIMLAAAGVFGFVVLLGIIATLRSKDGTLVVEVDQPGARVEVLDAENKIIVTQASGDVPMVFTVSPGKRKVQVEKDGFKAYGEELELATRGQAVVRARLEKLTSAGGGLVLNVNEPDALVEVLATTGKIEATYRSGPTDLRIPLIAGKYQLRLEKAGFQSVTQAVTIDSTGEQRLSLTLVPAGSAAAAQTAPTPLPAAAPPAAATPNSSPAANNSSETIGPDFFKDGNNEVTPDFFKDK